MNDSYIFLNINKDKDNLYLEKIKKIVNENDYKFHFVNLYHDIIFFHHPYMWKNKNGINPDIGTIIRKKDVENGHWMFHRYNEKGTVLNYICSFIDIHGPIEIIDDDSISIKNNSHFNNEYIDFIKNIINYKKEVIVWPFVNDLNIYYKSVFIVYVSNIRRYTDFSYFINGGKVYFFSDECDFLNESLKEAKELNIPFEIVDYHNI